MATAKKTTTKKVSKKEVAEAPVAESVVDLSKVTDIAKTLREFRFGSAGSKAKNTSLPKVLRRQRARLLTEERTVKTLAK